MNRALAIFLLVVLGAWAAAQCFHACVLYLAVQPPSVRYPADLFLWVDRGGIVLGAGGALRSPNGHTLEFEVGRPRWDRVLPWNLAPGRYMFYIRFWLAALTPATLLAWRWRQSRRRRIQGFEVQPTERAATGDKQ
jgi:hypothetical protein